MDGIGRFCIVLNVLYFGVHNNGIVVLGPPPNYEIMEFILFSKIAICCLNFFAYSV